MRHRKSFCGKKKRGLKRNTCTERGIRWSLKVKRVKDTIINLRGIKYTLKTCMS